MLGYKGQRAAARAFNPTSETGNSGRQRKRAECGFAPLRHPPWFVQATAFGWATLKPSEGRAPDTVAQNPVSISG
jgi:hypothetical protein